MNNNSFLQRFSRLEGGWFIIMAAVLWGTTGTAQAFSPSGTQPMTVGTIRLVFGAMTLAVLAAHRKELGGLRRWRSWLHWTTILAAIGIASYQVLFFAGVARTGVAVGTIVGIGSTPIAAGILVFIWHRERPGRRWAIATILAIVGCSFLILTGGDVQIDPLGILLAIGAGASYALYTLLSKELLADHPAGLVLTITFFLGIAFLLPVLLFGDFSWLAEPLGLGVALHLGVITVGAAYWLFAMGLSTVPVATAATLTLAEPLTAGLLGVIVLGEVLNWSVALGMALILVGLLVLTKKSSPPVAETPPMAVEFPDANKSDSFQVKNGS